MSKENIEVYKQCLKDFSDRILGYLVSDGLVFADDVVNEGLVSIGYSGEELKNIVIPAKVGDRFVTSIGEKAFYCCSSLSSVSFASDGKLKTIGERAFQGTSIASVNIPASVETIGEYAFGSNFLLESAAFYRSVEEGKSLGGYSSRMFYDCRKLKTIYVPNSSKDAYASLLSNSQEKLVVYDTGTALTLTDEKGITELTSPSIYATCALNYSRKVETTTGEYVTVCLPFAVDLSKTTGVFEKVYVPLNTMIHDLAHSDDTKENFILMLKEQAADAEIPANQPMIVKLADGKDEFTFTNSEDAKLSKDLMPSAISMTVLDWDGTSGLIRLFLHVDGLSISHVKTYSIGIGVSDGSTTGIREIISADTIGTAGLSLHDGVIYDLNGRKVTTADRIKSLSKGIYILNGKKMVVK